VLIDDTHRWFAVTHDRSLSEANPDILSFDDLIECRLDILTCPKGRKGNCYEKCDKKRVTALVLALIMIFALGENGELCVSYPTSVLREDGYGGLESVPDAGIIFTPSIYVYPEGSINIWDTATHCYLINTTGLGDKDAAALYIKIEVESDEQLPLVEAILSTLRVNK